MPEEIPSGMTGTFIDNRAALVDDEVVRLDKSIAARSAKVA